MTPITSPHNPRLKQLRKLARSRERERTGLFVAEGEDLVLAAQAAGREPVFGFCAPGVELGASGAGIPGFEEIAPELLADVSTLGSGTRAIGVYEQEFNVFKAPLCVYLYAIKDPGNVGTVLRSALAFGAAVALGPGCADPHSPKAVRASMGAIFAVPIGRVTAIDELPGERVALVAHAGKPLASLQTTCPVTLLVGAERDGLPQEVTDSCDHVAHIPIANESLNAAMAATVALYEMTRQIDGLTDRGARLASLRSAAPPSRVPAR
ncbi:MAG TPA: RNA methyltransferase [Solirubrobacteraceae bacterium]|jgi:TrmH family RNA methyltransferase|nr:RNA methyltransferase [Solirubrobacteraceae bacterium]